MKLVIQTNISVNHYRLFTLCVFDYSYTHIHTVDTDHVTDMCLSENSHEDTLSLRDAQTLRHTCSQSSHVYICMIPTDNRVLDVSGSLFSQVLSKHSSWSTFLQSLGSSMSRICMSDLRFVVSTHLPTIPFST